MIPQGTSPVNPQYYTAMTDRVNNAKSCSELQTLATQLINSLNAEGAAISAQLALLVPISALLNPPDTPSAAITWIENFITGVLQPMYKPWETYVAQIAARTVAIEALMASIAAKAASFTSCEVTPPAVVPPTIPG